MAKSPRLVSVHDGFQCTPSCVYNRYKPFLTSGEAFNLLTRSAWEYGAKHSVNWYVALVLPHLIDWIVFDDWSMCFSVGMRSYTGSPPKNGTA